MQVVSLNGIAVGYAGRTIFQDLSWAIGPRERVGLVGPNGSGKSSLLRAIKGELETDRGSITRLAGARIGYLPQDIELPPERTLIDEAGALPPRLAEVQDELQRIEARLADPEVYGDEGRLERMLARHERALARFEELGGAQHESRAASLLAQLGFAPEEHDKPTAQLSGGQRKLASLARLALESPDVLLLDEPDNHLDLADKRMLERFIRDYEGSVVIVSHDRYLLDETVTQIAELEDGAFTLYRGNYSGYVSARELERLRQQRRYADQQKEIARIEASIERFERWASQVVNPRHIKQARSRRRWLERMEERGEMIDPVRERRRMDLVLQGSRGSVQAVELRGVSARFGDQTVFENLDLMVRHGERVGLIGPNGAGKSVLLRMVMGQIKPSNGQVRIGPSTRVGYYSQEHETLAEFRTRTPLELVRHTAPLAEGPAVSFLLRFLFQYDQVRQPIASLSGGERSRLQLACLMLEKPNLLVLDEPTNNLDIASAEVLEDAIESFEGTVLTVSHDRYFLDRVVDQLVELRHGALTHHPGNASDFLHSPK